MTASFLISTCSFSASSTPSYYSTATYDLLNRTVQVSRPIDAGNRYRGSALQHPALVPAFTQSGGIVLTHDVVQTIKSGHDLSD